MNSTTATESVMYLQQVIPTIQSPLFCQGEHELLISNCYYTNTEVVVEFADDNNQKLKQFFNFDSRLVNFAKLISEILGEIPIGFKPSMIIGLKVYAVIHHNYLSNGKGYANIGYCIRIEN